jgi:hypothetical protein
MSVMLKIPPVLQSGYDVHYLSKSPRRDSTRCMLHQYNEPFLNTTDLRVAAEDHSSSRVLQHSPWRSHSVRASRSERAPATDTLSARIRLEE